MNKKELWHTLTSIPVSERNCDNCIHGGQKLFDDCEISSPIGVLCRDMKRDFGPKSAWEHKKDE